MSATGGKWIYLSATGGTWISVSAVLHSYLVGVLAQSTNTDYIRPKNELQSIFSYSAHKRGISKRPWASRRWNLFTLLLPVQSPLSLSLSLSLSLWCQSVLYSLRQLPLLFSQAVRRWGKRKGVQRPLPCIQLDLNDAVRKDGYNLILWRSCTWYLIRPTVYKNLSAKHREFCCRFQLPRSGAAQVWIHLKYWKSTSSVSLGCSSDRDE